MRILVLSSAVCCLGLVMGCAQPEPEPVMPEPVYDKYGNEIVGDGCTQTAGSANCYPRGDYQPPSSGQRGGGAQGGGRGGTGQGTGTGAAGVP